MTKVDPSASATPHANQNPRVSVVICTHNRAGVIASSVGSTLVQTISPPEIEVLVIDNGSTDGTAAVVTELARRNGHLRLISEPKLGLSVARNRGIEEARGTIVAYLDDDAIADRGWAAALLAAYDDVPDAVAVGGPISLGFAVTPPSWLPERALDAYGRLFLGKARRVSGNTLFGGNMSFRRQVLREFGGFDHRLGRTGQDLIGGEESDLFVRLERAAEGPIVYEPEAHVVHMIDTDRLNLRWLLRRAWGDGRTTHMWRPPDPLPHAVTTLAKAAANFGVALVLAPIGWVAPRAMKQAVTRAMRGAYHLGAASVRSGSVPIDARDRVRAERPS